MTFNYNTLTDLIPSGFFTFTKSHVIFMAESSNAFLGDTIFFLILFFSVTSASFLLNLKHTYAYVYSRGTTVIDISAMLIIVYLFS